MRKVTAFEESDLQTTGSGGFYICASPHELIEDRPGWMKQGLTETATGYGTRLNTGRKILYCGKVYRLYANCYSNVATTYFTVKKQRIYVD